MKLWIGLLNGLMLSAVVWGMLWTGVYSVFAAREFNLANPETRDTINKGKTVSLLIDFRIPLAIVRIGKGYLVEGEFVSERGQEYIFED